MLEIVEMLQGIFERSLIFSLVVAAVHISSRIIKFDDLSIEGSFGTGGAIIALCLVNQVPLYIGMPLVLIAGGLCGLATGLLYTKLKLNNLISGIVVVTALFSINLKIASSNLPLLHVTTLFDYLEDTVGSMKFLGILVPIVSFVIIGITWLLKTEIGFLLFAVGTNPQMLINLGKNVHIYKIAGLILSNMLAALAGALFVQYVGYFSIWANVGILITALAGLILADTINSNFGWAIIGGALFYQIVVATTFELQIDQDWNKLITALLIIGLIIVKQHIKFFKNKDISC